MKMFNLQTIMPLHYKIKNQWKHSFMERYRIFISARIVKYRMSPQKELSIEIYVSMHLGKMRRLLTIGTVDEKEILNEKEIHFVLNLDNGRTLRFSGT